MHSVSPVNSPDHRPSLLIAALSGRALAELARKAGYRALDAMERHLDGRDWLVGDAMTLAPSCVRSGEMRVVPAHAYGADPRYRMTACSKRVFTGP